MKRFRSLSKRDKNTLFSDFAFMLIGNLSLAFGAAIFLTKLEVVAGGLSGISIIVQHFIKTQIIDIIVLIATWILWFVGLLFVGKEFALKTLASSIVYPLALSMFLRVPIFQEFSEQICYYGINETDIGKILDGEIAKPIGNLLICGIFGGVFIGVGVALNFRSGGSTGGVDIILAILAKYLNIKESISSFAVDGLVILVAMFVISKNFVPGLIGILSAFISSLMIEAVFVSSQTSFQVDIISNSWKEISDYAQNILGRGVTIIPANGGYKGDERTILRIVFPKSQFNRIRSFILEIDSKAFITFTQTNAVYGEGFMSLYKKSNKKNT